MNSSILGAASAQIGGAIRGFHSRLDRFPTHIPLPSGTQSVGQSNSQALAADEAVSPTCAFGRIRSNTQPTVATNKNIHETTQDRL
jgi:hypothetical protein